MNLAAALAWKFGPVADTAGDAITGWRHDTLPEPDAGEIASLLVEYDLHDRKETRKEEIEAEGNGLIDAQTGENSRKRMMLVAEGVAIIDAQVGHAGPPNPRNPRQDALTGIFTYVAEVTTNMEAAFVEIDDVATTDPSTVVLVHPTLPA